MESCAEGPNNMPTARGLEIGTRPTSQLLGGAAASTSSRTTLSRRASPVVFHTYEEGSVINIDYDKSWYHSEEEARAVCSKDVGCKGYWERDGDRNGVGDGIFFVLNVTSSREFSKGTGSVTATATVLATAYSSF